MSQLNLQTPLTDKVIATLRAGDVVHISGVLLAARDAAHKRLVETLDAGQPLPVDLNKQILYYVGPAPAKAGHIIGPAGPTTSGRMDPYTITMLEQGVTGMIGKGHRSEEIKRALCDYRAVYFAAVGGAAALLARCITAVETLAYPELGPEAIRRLEVDSFPVVVVNDIYGGDAYSGTSG